ncbi:hypothetical protein [Subtercola frigoramans]|uniref:Uncharacterized protein n=1 Tax=Subtercola frigoramans TaxID=120298 RepID=A0ABS2L254_9MICO|nr:hypothetical protein [Subtercola frigoramans]MBM7470566.1 hypothetical protein [Subtercola frigoramans]
MSTDGKNESQADHTTDGKSGGELAELIATVDEEHGDKGATAMSDRLRNKTPETQAEPENPGDVED